MMPLAMFYSQICLHSKLVKRKLAHYKCLLRLYNKVHKVMVPMEEFFTYMSLKVKFTTI